MSRQDPDDVFYDPRSEEAVRLERVRLDGRPVQFPRTNYFAVLRIESGAGRFWADASRYPFGPRSLLFFVPYQRIRFEPDEAVRGDVVQFHANFLCVETFHAEVGCSGVLFNDPHGAPSVQLDRATDAEIVALLARIRREDAERQTAFHEVMLSSLKVLLVLAARLKTASLPACGSAGAAFQNPVLIEFRELIERNYRTLHSPAQYAELLHLTPKTLGRIVRETLGSTPTELIRSRILTDAKWQLLHTLKPVREIARELGYQDELYFSRLFKKATGCSPTFFRKFETEIRGGSNLSMSSSGPPIPDADANADTAARSKTFDPPGT